MFVTFKLCLVICLIKNISLNILNYKIVFGFFSNKTHHN
jgi:hypothetical protein